MPDQPVRVVRLQAKDWGIWIGILVTLLTGAGFILGLMFYPRDQGNRVRADLDHHVDSANPKIEKLEETSDDLTKALHRIEIRQVEMAPRRVRDKLPEVPPLRGEP